MAPTSSSWGVTQMRWRREDVHHWLVCNRLCRGKLAPHRKPACAAGFQFERTLARQLSPRALCTELGLSKKYEQAAGIARKKRVSVAAHPLESPQPRTRLMNACRRMHCLDHQRQKPQFLRADLRCASQLYRRNPPISSGLPLFKNDNCHAGRGRIPLNEFWTLVELP